MGTKYVCFEIHNGYYLPCTIPTTLEGAKEMEQSLIESLPHKAYTVLTQEEGLFLKNVIDRHIVFRGKTVRFQKETLKKSYWDISITFEADGSIEMYSGYVNGAVNSKEKTEILNGEQAEKYMQENKEYIIEIYEK